MECGSGAFECIIGLLLCVGVSVVDGEFGGFCGGCAG